MTRPDDEQQRNDSDWLFTCVVSAVALLPRLFVALSWAREPVWDGHYYHFGATRIAAGLGYSEDIVVHGASVWKAWSHYPVGYSALLGAIYRVFGSGLAVAPVTNAMLGAFTVLAVHRVARYHLSVNRARVAATLVALHPGLIVYTAVLMTEPLAALLLILAVLSCVRFHFDLRSIVLSGVFIGLATLVRTSSLLAAPLLVLCFPRPLSSALKRAALVTLVAATVTLPWTLRNCVVMDGCAFVSTNGGWNLAIGALTPDGRFTTLRATDGCPVVTGQVQQDRCWAKVGKEVIQQDPARWAALMPAKLAHTYDHESFPIEYLHEADPIDWPEARRAAGRDLLSALHRLLLVAATLGVVAFPPSPRSDRKAFSVQLALCATVLLFAAYAFYSDAHPFYPFAIALPLLAIAPLPGAPEIGPVGKYLLGLILLTTLTHAIFFGDDRYHLVVTPALCILAAGALRRSQRASLAGQ